MAGDQGIRAGKAYVEITTDQSKLEAGLQRVQKQLWTMGETFDRIGKSFIKVGATALAPFALGLKQLAAVDSQVAKDLTAIRDAFNGILIAIGRVVHGALKPYIGLITSACQATALWIQQHATLVLKILAVAAAIMAVGTALVAIGAIIKAVSGFIAVLSAVVTIGRKAWMAYASAAAIAKMVLAFFADWKKALAIVAAIGAITAGIVWSVKKLNKMFDDWVGGFTFNFGKMPDLNGASAQISETRNTYAHLNGEAFTHLFGGAVQQNIAKSQLDELKSMNRTTNSINTQLMGLIGG